MRDSGYYSQRTAGAKIAIDTTQPKLEIALKEIPKKSILRIADFGSADGGTSQEMWSNLINQIKEDKDPRQNAEAVTKRILEERPEEAYLLGLGRGDDGGGRVFQHHQSTPHHAQGFSISRSGHPSLR